MNWEFIKVRAACRGINLYTAEEEMCLLERLPVWWDSADLPNFLRYVLDV